MGVERALLQDSEVPLPVHIPPDSLFVLGVVVLRGEVLVHGAFLKLLHEVPGEPGHEFHNGN